MKYRWLSLTLATFASFFTAASAEVGPVSISHDFGVTEYYDSNLFRLAPAEKAGQPSIDDFIVEPRARIAARLPVSLQTIELRGGLGYAFHRYNRALDSETLDLLARWRWQVSDVCDGAIDFGWTRRQVEFDDVETRRRLVQAGRSTSAEGSCAVTPRLRASIDHQSAARDNRDPLRRIFDLNERSTEGRLTYGTADTLNLYAFGRSRRRSQPGAPSPAGAGIDARARIRDLGGGFAWQVTPKMHLQGAFYRSRLRETGGLRDNTTSSGELSGEWLVTAKTRMRVSGEKLLDVSPNISAIAFARRTIRAELDWAATPKFSATFAAGKSWRDILRTRLDPAGNPFERFERDRTRSLEASVAYAFDDMWRGRAGFAHRVRDANFADLRFRATILSFSLTYAFSHPHDAREDFGPKGFP